MPAGHYPIVLDLDGKPCLVVGGGEVATAKVQGLLLSGAHVVVVSPTLTETLGRLAKQGPVVHRARDFRDDDVIGCALVIAATDRPEVNSAIFRLARRHRILVNVVDTPAECDFYTPAVVQRGALQIAISTNGKIPGLARRIREELETRFGPEYARYVEVLGEFRQGLRHRGDSLERRQSLCARVLDSDLLEAVRTGNEARIEALLASSGGTAASAIAPATAGTD